MPPHFLKGRDYVFESRLATADDAVVFKAIDRETGEEVHSRQHSA